MSSTQLSCPHCGSMLSFGDQVAASEVVSCLICNRSFQVPGDACAAPAAAIAESIPMPVLEMAMQVESPAFVQSAAAATIPVLEPAMATSPPVAPPMTIDVA